MTQIARVDYTMYAGEDFASSVEWQGEDLHDFDVLMQVRDSAGVLILELGTLDATLTVNGDGAVVVALSKVQTRAIAPGHYDYDMHIQDKVSGNVIPLTYGVFRLFASIVDRAPSVVAP